MTIIVGTDVYATIADADAYWSARGNALWSNLSTSAKEVLLVKATDWLDRSFRFRGKRLTDDQTLAWPRLNACDDDGYEVGATSAPRQVKDAMYIVSDILRDGSNDLNGILTNDAAVERQKVDVIEIEYDVSAKLRGGDVLTHVYELLAPVIVSNVLRRT